MQPTRHSVEVRLIGKLPLKYEIMMISGVSIRAETRRIKSPFTT